MYTQSYNRPSLFEYLDNYEAGNTDALNSLAAKSASDPGQDALAVQASLVSLSNIDQLVDNVNSGESSVSQSTITDMLDFYSQQVSSEVEDLAERFGVTDVPGFAYQGGQWQYLAADEATNSEQQLLDYFNRDSRLSDRLERVQSLTQLHELSASQTFAAGVQEAGFSNTEVETYLLDTRASVLAHDYLGIEQGQFKLGSLGLASEHYETLIDSKE